MTAEDLRKSILQQAIQGKLVPQDPTDEPASALLARIREEKARLVKEKKIKKDKNESLIYRGDDNSYYEKFADGTVKCIDEEIPFEIPQGWEWARFSTIVNHAPSVVADDDSDVAFMPMALIDAGYNGGYTYELKKWSSVKTGFTKMSAGDIAYAKITPCFQNRKSFILTSAPNNTAAATTELNVLRLYGETFDRWYILFFLKSEYFIRNAKYKGTAGQQRVLSSYVSEKLVPIPPYAEQRRIVERINLLLRVVEKYELHQYKLSNLEKELLPSLKKSILQYAIQGKLVPQNPEDEPASELLKHIEEEKARLVKAGKIKRDKNASLIFKGDDNKYFEKKGNEVICIDDELPFEIPESWTWIRFKNLVNFSLGRTPERVVPEFWNPPCIPWVSIADMEDKGILTHTKEKISKKAFEDKFGGQYSPAGTLIMSFKLTIGKVSILGVDATHNEAIISIFPYLDKDNVTRDFLSNFLSIITGYTSSTDAIKGAILNAKKMSEMLVPLPPLNEQKRIVEALDNVVASIMRN
jgi:type I restriction enzyme S subunit